MLILSIIIITTAHILRTMRWSLLIENYEQPKFSRLLASLSTGYIINSLIPFKAGELFRAAIAGKGMKNGRGFALATVIIERCLDVITVGIIFGIMQLMGVSEVVSTNFTTYIGLALVLCGGLILSVLLKSPVKMAIKGVAGIFNSSIEEKILRFFWALIWGFKNMLKNISRVKLIVYTVVMWALYMLSYYCFALYQSGDILEVFCSLFSVNVLLSRQIFLSQYVSYYVMFLMLPPVLLLIVAAVIKVITESKQKSFDKDNDNEYLSLVPYVDAEERRNFLENYFSGENREYVDNYLSLIKNVLVLRDESAGSNATTILCTDGKETFYRKYAFGEDGKKLSEQLRWINTHSEQLPLCKVIKSEELDQFCYYDMPYLSNAAGLFEYAHSNPAEATFTYIKAALDSLNSSLYVLNKRPADKETIDRYISEKVEKNYNKIQSARYIKDMQKYDTIIINGVEYKNLNYYRKYLDSEYLTSIFAKDSYSDIHGDLTVENIICVKNNDSQDDFYIIDPNTGNVHDSANLDFAKLLQSLHGNYEFLMRTDNVAVHRNTIDFTFIKSEAYKNLYDMYHKYLQENFDADTVKSIYYHEIVHWLRLMPYKIEKNGKRAMLFYAGLLMVLDDVIRMFENDAHQEKV